MMIPDATTLATIACQWEATARKLGNVHPKSDYEDCTYTDFLNSAVVFGQALRATETQSVGESILQAVQLRKNVCTTNTNLGMILLLTPLAKVPSHLQLQEDLPKVLKSLTVQDSEWAFQAIRLASPGGLGQADEQDVAEAPTLPLQAIMSLAADRDQIARQYATDYRELFEFGVPSLIQGWQEWQCLEAAIIECQLCLLSKYPDSLISRKNGSIVARQVLDQIQSTNALGGLKTAPGRRALRMLDQQFRAQRHRQNPGTTADLIAACLFIALRENMLTVDMKFPWNSPDWL